MGIVYAVLRVFALQSMDYALLVFVGAAVATFVASVMAEEQSTRIKNGAFGALAGSAVGGLAAIFAEDEKLLVVGFVGSAVGALLGWLAAVLLCLWASTYNTGKHVLVYLTGGFKEVREKLELEADQPLLDALNRWSEDFVRKMNRQKEVTLQFAQNEQTNGCIRLTIGDWLVSIVSILDLLFGLAKRPKYRSRVTVIVYGKQDGGVLGRHWVSDSGALASHMKRDFDDRSIGYQVLAGELSSPYFTTAEEAKLHAQDRGEERYRPFLTLHVNGSVILAVDWHEGLEPNDRFVDRARALFQNDVCPAIAALLQHWDGDIGREVHLGPLA